MKKSFSLTAKAISIGVLLISFSFGSLHSQDLIPSQWPNLVGYWKFQDTSNLTAATVGNDLTLIGQHQAVAGAFYGDTAIRIDTGSYYKVYHNIAPNGGGDSVNQYTLMFDFKVLSLDKWHAFFQTDTTNTNDGDCFIKHTGDSIPGTIGVGYTGYSSDSILPNEWYRLVISVNLGHFYNYYLNGVLLHIGDTDDIFIDQRFALTPAILFFADNNQEDDTIDIASIAIFDTCLTPSQIAQIGTIDPCIANPPVVSLGNFITLFQDTIYFLDAGPGYKSYLWSTGDTTQSIFITNMYNNWKYDTIGVVVTDMNDCVASDSIIIYWTYEGINEISRDYFNIYPNPSDGSFVISLWQDVDLITIYSSLGQELNEIRNLKKGDNLIDLSNLKSGFYYMKIHTDKADYSQRIIIQK